MSVSYSDQESISCTSSEEDEVWNLGSGDLYNLNNNQSGKILKQHTESLLNSYEFINANYNYDTLRSHLVSQPNSTKNYKNFISFTQEDLVPITCSELIPKDKIHKNDSEKYERFTKWYT